MKTKTFIIKVLNLIAIILLLSTLLVLAIKNRHSSALISVKPNFGGDIHLQNQMFLILIIRKIPCLQLNNNISFNIYQYIYKPYISAYLLLTALVILSVTKLAKLLLELGWELLGEVTINDTLGSLYGI